jgi:hypothetical protein
MAGVEDMLKIDERDGTGDGVGVDQRSHVLLFSDTTSVGRTDALNSWVSNDTGLRSLIIYVGSSVLHRGLCPREGIGNGAVTPTRSSYYYLSLLEDMMHDVPQPGQADE